MLDNPKPFPPKRGYDLERWGLSGWRATAVAYCKREGVRGVSHANGYYYTLGELEDALIG